MINSEKSIFNCIYNILTTKQHFCIFVEEMLCSLIIVPIHTFKDIFTSNFNL